jgi:mannose-1-phosphate guanylyltransferase
MSNFFVINADICCAFPLKEMMQAHERHRGVGTIMGVNVRLAQCLQFLCVQSAFNP